MASALGGSPRPPTQKVRWDKVNRLQDLPQIFASKRRHSDVIDVNEFEYVNKQSLTNQRLAFFQQVA